MPHDTTAEADSVEALVDELHRSLEAGDVEKVAALHARDADIVQIGAEREEHWIGWDLVRAAIRSRVESFQALHVSCRGRVVKVLGGGDAACFSQVLDLRITGDTGRTELVHARLTGAAEMRGGRWVLAQTHLSLPAS